MIREATITEIDKVLNQPGVIESFVGAGFDHIDISGFYQANEGRNIALTDGTGIMLFVPRGTDFACHSLFPPGHRGKSAIMAARAMLDLVFTVYGASGIVGVPPRDNRAVRLMGYLLGFRPTGETVTDSLNRECVIYRLEAQQWAT